MPPNPEPHALLLHAPHRDASPLPPVCLALRTRPLSRPFVFGSTEDSRQPEVPPSPDTAFTLSAFAPCALLTSLPSRTGLRHACVWRSVQQVGSQPPATGLPIDHRLVYRQCRAPSRVNLSPLGIFRVGAFRALSAASRCHLRGATESVALNYRLSPSRRVA